MRVRSAARLDSHEHPDPMTSPDDKTVIVSQAPASDSRPATSSAASIDSHHALAIGTRVAEFEIKGLIGEGGFGIVYLAYDTQLGRNVALKEYMPAALASRGNNAEVTVRSERHEETFRAGLRSFVNEARLLAQFDHHSLVKVYRFWEANGTAYMVMPYYEGVTLRDTLRAMRSPPDEAWLRALLTPLVSALGVMHAAQCYHRDIAPDNILLLKGSGRPLLLDFGAARRVIGDMTQALTVILKPGYAPIEQYAEVPTLKQGPWTDIYALAAVVYFAIVGKTPPPSVGRMMSDSYVPLATLAADRYSPAFAQTIDHALAVRPEERPQNVQTFATGLGLALGGEHDSRDDALASAASRVAAAASVGAVESREAGATSAARSEGNERADSGVSSSPASARSVADAQPHAKSGRSAAIAIGAVAVVGLAALGGWYAMRPAPPTTPSARPSATATAGSAGHTDMARAASSSHAAPTLPTQAQAASSTTASASTSNATASVSARASGNAAPDTTRAAAVPLPPYTPGGELERIATLSDPSIRVTATSRSGTARINKDRLQFRISSNRAGYVYVFMVDPAGQYLMLFPNGLDKNNTIAAGQSISLPRASWPMTAGAPAGPNRFLVLVSPTQRDFSDGGLHGESVFAEFPEQAQRAAAVRRTASYSPFAGQARCAASATDCPDTFGAATFTIDVVSPST
ncbi:serine/threonine-protein kinase [Paraburkholderia diazotrophica]|uniref:non-specific serine/threonine protein kinase n=1 Tax=Paraburkholderia diazotrophica TaxID=667676 RepID=A0A1H6WTZ2_9BURK|nr:serine/threonine-protein kinase [Paraburkholderia diazotrophica]SEJ18714.1 Serine/threonine protein kinase [Paraburkholderia diazotrophica]